MLNPIQTHESHLASYEANQASTQERLAEIAEETRALHEEIENLTERIRSLGETNSQIDVRFSSSQFTTPNLLISRCRQLWRKCLSSAQKSSMQCKAGSRGFKMPKLSSPARNENVLPFKTSSLSEPSSLFTQQPDLTSPW